MPACGFLPLHKKNNNRCLQAATKRMGDAIAKSGRDIVYYVDNGPTNPPRVYNPK